MTQTVLLGNLVDISSSKRIFYKEYVNSGVPFYRSKEIIERAAGKKNISTELFISEERFNEIEGKFGAPKGGDLLLTSVGTLGIPYLVQQGEKFYFKDGNLTWFRNFKPELNRNYFLYWLTSQDGKNELLNHTIGSTQKALTIQGLKRVKVPLPDIETQKKIADILGSIDEKIELNRKMNETLEQMGQALFRHYFINNPEANKWSTRTLGDFFDVKTGKKDANFGTSDGKYPFFTCSQNVSKAPDYSFDGTALLLAGNGEFNLKYYRGKFEAYQRTYVLMPNNENHLGYLFFLMSLFLDEITNGSRGSVIKFITKGMIENFKINAPDDLTISKLSETLNQITINIEKNKEQIQTLTNLRDALLPRLISGKIKI